LDVVFTIEILIECRSPHARVIKVRSAPNTFSNPYRSRVESLKLIDAAGALRHLVEIQFIPRRFNTVQRSEGRYAFRIYGWGSSHFFYRQIWRQTGLGDGWSHRHSSKIEVNNLLARHAQSYRSAEDRRSHRRAAMCSQPLTMLPAPTVLVNT
jgi:hypothetical protein